MFRTLLLLASATGIPRLVLRLLMDRRVPLGLKMLLPAALVYVVLPLDLVPDALATLGRVDDLLAVLIATGIFVALAPREVVREHLRRGRAGGPTQNPQDARRSDPNIIDGSFRYIDQDEGSPD